MNFVVYIMILNEFQNSSLMLVQQALLLLLCLKKLLHFCHTSVNLKTNNFPGVSFLSLCRSPSFFLSKNTLVGRDVPDIRHYPVFGQVSG